MCRRARFFLNNFVPLYVVVELDVPILIPFFHAVVELDVKMFWHVKFRNSFVPI